MSLLISGLDTEQRAALVAILLKDLTQEARDAGRAPWVALMRSAALDYLRTTGSLTLETPVSVTDWDYSPGNTGTETLESKTLGEMGTALAEDERADAQEVANTRWVLCLTSEEREAVMGAYDRQKARAKAIGEASGNVVRLGETLIQANSTVKTLCRELEALRHELHPGAITLREARICEAEAHVKALRDQYEQARAALNAL